MSRVALQRVCLNVGDAVAVHTSSVPRLAT